ncbi:sensor histidine kinase [Solirubrobacter soli]|uniref:sensor histidine kinase n=1 Tax=Solirubrobacter soli TaxID=363832 RepID=UPI0004104114|nr:ATP-binding protein [Solirubrobacter soli]
MSARAGLLVWSGAAALGLVAEAAAYSWDQPGRWVPDLAVGLTFIACGLLAWERRRGAGALLAATGVTWFLGTYSTDLVYLHRGPLVHLLIAYPRARPRSRIDGVAIAAGYAAAIATPIWSSDAASVILAIALVALVGRGAAGRARRERIAARAAAVAFAAVLVVSAAARLVFPAGDVKDPALLAYELVLLAIAIGLYLPLRGPKSTAVADLVVELGETRSGLLGGRLARALGDPTLEVGYWSPDAGGYLNETGERLAVPEPASGRLATPVERDGLPFAMLVHDAAVLADPALVEAVASAARLTASNVALQAERRVRAGEVMASRRRLLVAADRERRALEARLRRGPEQRLAEVGSLLAGVSGDAGGAHLDRARAQLVRTLDDLHELARGLHPHELVEAGLSGALASLAERSPVPVELDVRVRRLPDEVEVTIYFICAEALANVVKYASASRVRLSVQATDGGLCLRVADDGIGGADFARGTGLQGLADRVETLGGTLQLASPPGEGTELIAEIPLAADPLPRSGNEEVRERRPPRA